MRAEIPEERFLVESDEEASPDPNHRRAKIVRRAAEIVAPALFYSIPVIGLSAPSPLDRSWTTPYATKRPTAPAFRITA